MQRGARKRACCSPQAKGTLHLGKTMGGSLLSSGSGALCALAPAVMWGMLPEQLLSVLPGDKGYARHCRVPDC